MTVVAYREYIESDEWKLRRVAALERSAKRERLFPFPSCEFCGKSGRSHKKRRSDLDSRERPFRVEDSNGLHVHHVSYERLGDEEPDDLIVLCTDVLYVEDCIARRIPSADRVGCHERAHDDLATRSEVAQIARRRTY